MKRSAFAGLVVLVVAGCSTESNLAPTDPLAPGISFQIVDGAHDGGSPDFFFLPPIVPNPGGGGTFNPNAAPTVKICARNATNTACVVAPTVYTDVDANNNHYKLDWKVPKSTTVYYRVSVEVGGIELGFADVNTGNTNLDPNEFVNRKDGSHLPIKFRILTHCSERNGHNGHNGHNGDNDDDHHPGGDLRAQSNDANGRDDDDHGDDGDDDGEGGAACSEGHIGTGGGTVFFTDGGETIGGVTIPAGNGGPFSVTIQYCSNPDNIQVDIPVFGSCLFVFVRDANGEVVGENGLTIPGEVFVCDADDAAPPTQEGLVTLHRERGSEVQALPHSEGSCPGVVTSFGGFGRALAHGHWKRAGRQFLGALSPKPLYARRLNLGAGGKTCCFSNFQFALPSKMEIFGGDNQSGEFGTTLADPLEVLVTDLANQPVQNAKVHFAPTAGSGLVSAQVVVTGVNGIAAVNWTLPPSDPDHELNVNATGFGIASPPQCDPETETCTFSDGPRPGVDPFIPCFASEEGCSPTGAIQLQTGKLTFTAFGCEGPCFFDELRVPTSVKATDLLVGPQRGKASQPAARLPRVLPLPKPGKRVNH